jgi:ABC-type transporter Mla MlaB component
MLLIKKVEESFYSVSLSVKVDELNRPVCHHIKKELTPLLKAHRKITLDLKGVKLIDSGGEKILEELLNLAKSRKCVIQCIHLENAIADKINSIEQEHIKQHDEQSV